MKTTTVRFDAETWDDIVRQSEALGIAHAEFIRGAVHRRLGRLVDTDRVAALEVRLESVANRLDATIRLVARLVSAAGLVNERRMNPVEGRGNSKPHLRLDQRS